MALAATNTIPTFDIWEDPLALLPRRKPQPLVRDQTIYSREDPAESLYLVVDGAVKISRVSPNTGRETVIDVVASESFFGISCLLHATERGEQAISLEKSQVMEWHVSDLRELIVRTPELGPALMRMVAHKLVEADSRIESFANDHIPRRLVKALLRLGERFGEHSGAETIRLMPLTHELLARHVGTSREIVTQHMSYLRKQGLLDYSRAGLEFDPVKLRESLETIR